MSGIVKSITISKHRSPLYGANETRVEVETQRQVLGFISLAEPHLRDPHIPESAKATYAEHLARDTAHHFAALLRREIEDVLVRYTPVMQPGDRLVYTRT